MVLKTVIVIKTKHNFWIILTDKIKLIKNQININKNKYLMSQVQSLFVKC